MNNSINEFKKMCKELGGSIQENHDEVKCVFPREKELLVTFTKHIYTDKETGFSIHDSSISIYDLDLGESYTIPITSGEGFKHKSEVHLTVGNAIDSLTTTTTEESKTTLYTRTEIRTLAKTKELKIEYNKLLKMHSIQL